MPDSRLPRRPARSRRSTLHANRPRAPPRRIDGNRAGMQRSPAPREPGDRKVEAAPEEMHRARFSKKGGTKMREHLVRAQQRAPESIGVIAVVSRMCRIPIKRDCVDYFIRYLVDEHVYAELGQ